MVTVFTPTYNRAYIINKLYLSLLSQTDKDFEWVVVDDGSTDSTQEYFATLAKTEHAFAIKYVKQENGGKHRAINRGVQLAKGEIFFIVDSDDCLTSDAIEKIKRWFGTLDTTKKFAGVAGLRGYSSNRVIGGCGNESEYYLDAKNTQRKKYNLLGDKAEAYFTEILRAYPFPEFDGEKFVTEEVVWNAVAKHGYYLRWFNEIIYICDYLEDGLTKSGAAKYVNNPQGTLYWAQQQLAIFSDFKVRMKTIFTYYTAVRAKKKKREIAMDLGIHTCSVNLAVLLAKLKRVKL
jgi:glycosyltransferase involved in cell wall biosynthesis